VSRDEGLAPMRRLGAGARSRGQHRAGRAREGRTRRGGRRRDRARRGARRAARTTGGNHPAARAAGARDGGGHRTAPHRGRAAGHGGPGPLPPSRRAATRRPRSGGRWCRRHPVDRHRRGYARGVGALSPDQSAAGGRFSASVPKKQASPTPWAA